MELGITQSGLFSKFFMVFRSLLLLQAQLKIVYDLVSMRAVELLKQRGVAMDNQPPANQVGE